MIYLSHFSALIEHTDRVIYLEDDDITYILDGSKLFCKIVSIYFELVNSTPKYLKF